MDRSQRILRRAHQCDKKPASASGAARRRAKFLSLDEAPKLRERWNMAPFLMFDVWFPTHVLFCGEWREFLRNTSSLLEYRSWWLSSTHNSTKTSKSISFPLNLLTYALIDIDPLASGIWWNEKPYINVLSIKTQKQLQEALLHRPYFISSKCPAATALQLMWRSLS
jgi:hypothetical protein